MTSIRLESDEITASLDNFVSQIPTLYKSFGNIAVKDIKDHFQEIKDSSGNIWEPLSPKTIAQRRKSGKGARPLIDSGLMFLSVHAEDRKDRADIIVSRVNKGANIAAIQNYGTNDGRIPPREFMWVSPEAIKEMEALRDSIIRVV